MVEVGHLCAEWSRLIDVSSSRTRNFEQRPYGVGLGTQILSPPALYQSTSRKMAPIFALRNRSTMGNRMPKQGPRPHWYLMVLASRGTALLYLRGKIERKL